MKISQDARDFTAAQGMGKQTALSKDMEQKAVEFVEQGGVFTARLDFLIGVAR